MDIDFNSLYYHKPSSMIIIPKKYVRRNEQDGSSLVESILIEKDIIRYSYMIFSKEEIYENKIIKIDYEYIKQVTTYLHIFNLVFKHNSLHGFAK